MKLELSHDILALKIYNKASTEDKMVIKIRNFIQNRFVYFTDNNVLLSKDDLDYIRPYLRKINLEPHELIFIKRSRNRLKAKRFLIGFCILSIIFTIGYFMNRTEKVRSLSEEMLSTELRRYKDLEAQARVISDSLVKSRQGLHATEEELRIALLDLQKKQKPPPPPPPPKRRKINESKQRADQNANNPKKMAEAIKKLKELFKK